MIQALALAGLLSALQPTGPAQRTPARAPETALQDNRYMTYSDPREWIVSMRAHVFPDSRTTSYNTFPGWTYSDFALVMPYAPTSSVSWETKSDEPRVIASLGLNWEPANTGQIPTRTVPGTGAPYAWLSTPGVVVFSTAGAFIESRVTCVETEFDEKAAWDVPWADEPGLQAWLALDPVFDTVADDAPDQVQLLIDEWTGGNDPKQIPPVQLAKYLTACVLERTRTTGSNRQSPLGAGGFVIPLAEVDDPAARVRGYVAYTPRNNIGGFNVQNASVTARTRQGSEHDLSNLLTAVFRRAGLPARTVIGVDDEENGDDQVKSWVEFAIVPPDLGRPLWIPVDVWELESDGRSTRNWQQPWKHFGTTDELQTVPPVAYYFHPPANFRSYHLPALFGIRSDADLPDYGSQAVNFEVNRVPNRGGRQRRSP